MKRFRGKHVRSSEQNFLCPNLGEYWGDPLAEYFLCRGVEEGGGPTIISILAKINQKNKHTSKTHNEATCRRKNRELCRGRKLSKSRNKKGGRLSLLRKFFKKRVFKQSDRLGWLLKSGGFFQRQWNNPSLGRIQRNSL